MTRRNPNFLIIGGVASGTSFLSDCLTQHPEVYLSGASRPEPNFFHYSDKYAKGRSWYLSEYFDRATDELAVGERSSLLLNSPSAPGRIWDQLGPVKLVACLRSPHKRAEANYRFTCLEGLETLGLREAIISEERRLSALKGRWREVQPFAYAARSRYSEGVKRYLKIFGRENILFISSESLASDFPRTFRQVCSFLGVQETVAVTLPPKYSSPNVISLELQVELRSALGEHFIPAIEAIRTESLRPQRFPSRVRNHLELLHQNLTSQPLIEDGARDFVREQLAPEIEEMAKLDVLDVKEWSRDD